MRLERGVASAVLGRRHVLALSLVTIVLACSAGLAKAAPKADLWERWTKHNPGSSETLDHSGWDDFLKRNVKVSPDGVNRIAYGSVSPADKGALNSYISGLVATEVSALNRDEQRALWINLYNALTVQVILGAYPVESIRDIDVTPGWFSDGPWGKKFLTIEGEKVSLDDIEHRILRPIWRDPRIHYGVNCASIGCPNLGTEAVTAANAEAYLEQAARDYVNHRRGAEVSNGRLVVSSIYKWFQEDFGGSDKGVIAHLKKHAEPKLAAALSGVTKIFDHRYDWALNDAMPQEAKSARAARRSPGP